MAPDSVGFLRELSCPASGVGADELPQPAAPARKIQGKVSLCASPEENSHPGKGFRGVPPWFFPNPLSPLGGPPLHRIWFPGPDGGPAHLDVLDWLPHRGDLTEARNRGPPPGTAGTGKREGCEARAPGPPILGSSLRGMPGCRVVSAVKEPW
jgi:hypothetical protein